MSINSATYIAVSGLLATQVQMSVASANISNADTAGYSEKTANQAAQYSAGAGAGVTITGIDSTVNKLLLNSLIGATWDAGESKTASDYLNQLQQLYGETDGSNGSGTSLGNTLAALESSVSTLAATPNSASLQANVVDSLDAVTSQLNQLSDGIQKLRGNADQDISTSVDAVNQQLQLIGSLNLQIQQATALGQPTGDLEDQRNTALQTVASKMDVTYFTSANGGLQVYTTSGQALVDGSVHTLSYTPTATVNEGVTYSATPPSGFSGIAVSGIDITSQIHSGSLGALIDMRDDTLPDAQSQLDQLTNQLVSAVNGVHNAGTSLPPPTSLTGTTAVTPTTALSATGTARIAVADQDGDLVSYQDLNLASYTTVGALVTVLNGISGVSASIDGNGHLVISSTDPSDGIAINEMTGSVGPNQQGLSDFFGLNDLLTGTGASSVGVRSDILANSGLLATSTLDGSASPAAGSAVLTSGSATAANALYDALTGSTAFQAVGGLGATSTSFASYAADITGDVATKAAQASTNDTSKEATQSSFANTMASQSGVNLDQETARLSTLQNQYSASAELLQVINAMFAALMTALQSAPA